MALWLLYESQSWPNRSAWKPRLHADSGGHGFNTSYYFQSHSFSFAHVRAEEAKELADNSRQVPPFSLEATDPADVYPLHGIIPEPEWKALTVSAFYEAGSAYERKQVLPFRGSDWVNTRVEATMEQTDKDKDRKRTLKILFYIATMMAFHRATNRKFKKEDLPTKLNNVPQAVIDSLLGRFTECTRDSAECVLRYFLEPH
jgi:DNA-directed RNA polymerase I subunit RPA49